MAPRPGLAADPARDRRQSGAVHLHGARLQPYGLRTATGERPVQRRPYHGLVDHRGGAARRRHDRLHGEPGRGAGARLLDDLADARPGDHPGRALPEGLSRPPPVGAGPPDQAGKGGPRAGRASSPAWRRLAADRGPLRRQLRHDGLGETAGLIADLKVVAPGDANIRAARTDADRDIMRHAKPRAFLAPIHAERRRAQNGEARLFKRPGGRFRRNLGRCRLKSRAGPRMAVVCARQAPFSRKAPGERGRLIHIRGHIARRGDETTLLDQIAGDRQARDQQGGAGDPYEAALAKRQQAGRQSRRQTEVGQNTADRERQDPHAEVCAPQLASRSRRGDQQQARRQQRRREQQLGEHACLGAGIRHGGPPSQSAGGGQLIVLHPLAQRLLIDLARGAQRNVIDEDHVVRHPPFGDLALQEVEMLLLVLGLAVLELDQQHRPLVPLGVGRADDGGQGDLRMADGDVLDVDGADPLAARLDDVLGAVGDLHEAVGVNAGDVARVEETLVVEDISALSLEIGAGDGRSLDHHPAEGLAVVRHFLAAVVLDLQLDAQRRRALLQAPGHLFVIGLGLQLRRQIGDGADGRGLGHAPGVNHLDAELVLEPADQGFGTGRSADQNLAQDRRHGGREGDALGLHQLIDRGAVHLRARHDQLGPRRWTAKGYAPSIRMEHGHDRQDHLAGRRAHDRRLQAQQGMDEVRAVRIEHALRIAGRARGVAEAAGGLLVEAAPGHVAEDLLQHRLIGLGVRQLGLRHVGGVGHHNDPLDCRTVRQDGFEQRHEGQIGEDDPVFGVVDDVGQLLGEQARVQGVAHRADPHDAVPGLDVVGGVPGQGGDPVARLDPPGQQGVRHPARPLMNGGVGGADDRPLDRTAHDLAAAVPVLGVVEDLVDRQRPVLHHTQHSASSLVYAPG
uniref:LigA n=1 Tax=Parastrongyloides trichosuri TaxID=131310 RepID=A0A0N4ZXM1_PARTI